MKRKAFSWPRAWWTLRHLLGVPEHEVSGRERWAAMLTAAIGLIVVSVSASFFMPASTASLWLVASIGATAVLVFAVPHGQLSQPWPVLGGQVSSALMGVLVAHWMGGSMLAAGVAVGAAIGAMHLLRCIHPPGGATALSAVIAASHGAPPGWDYVLSPVLLNTLVIVVMAIVLNAPFEWRRYPAAWAMLRPPPVARSAALLPEAPFSQKHLRLALDELESFVDISDEDLAVLYHSLRRQQEHEALAVSALEIGGYYSNGEVGEAWSVRRIIDASEPDARRPQVIVKTVAGPGRGETRLMSRPDFLKWGRYRVRPDEGSWQRFGDL